VGSREGSIEAPRDGGALVASGLVSEIHADGLADSSQARRASYRFRTTDNSGEALVFVLRGPDGEEVVAGYVPTLLCVHRRAASSFSVVACQTDLANSWMTVGRQKTVEAREGSVHSTKLVG
jgi:hypothetical protein